MMTCAHCRAALLDRLYGLLDPAEVAAVDAHLAGCPACQAEQLRAARVQRLLAAAARTEFPDVRFTPPAVDAAPAPAAKSGGPRLRWLGWAVAAAVVLGVG